jgi:hypothetical protein
LKTGVSTIATTRLRMTVYNAVQPGNVYAPRCTGYVEVGFAAAAIAVPAIMPPLPASSARSGASGRAFGGPA